MTQTLPAADSLVSFCASQLARRIASGEVSAAEVLEAHLARIDSVNPQLNALVQPLFDDARVEAQQADATLRAAREASEPPPPLCGVPVSVKDCFDVRGTDCTLGIASRVGHPATHDSPLVARLRAAGAVVLGKTNVHQGMLMHEVDNPVFGRTLHPESDKRSPGGSSGGEAALVAAHCSALGLASDLGGSIRQPAHSCGVYGLKPTTGRLTSRGSYRAMPGMQAIALQAGPIARRVEDIDLAMRVLLEKSLVPQQPDEVIDPWPDFRQVDLEGARIGYVEDDDYFTPAPACRRAVRDSAHALQAAGALVEPFAIPDAGEMMRIYAGLVTSDGMESLRRMVSGNRLDRQVRRQLRLGGMPTAVRRVLQWALPLIGEHQLAQLLRATGRRRTYSFWQLVDDADSYRREFADAYTHGFDGHPLDAILLPPYGLPALRHGTALDVLPAASYCFLPNLLGWPAAVGPCTRVGETEECDRPASIDRVIRTARRVEIGSAGLPIGVQVMAAPWREDIVLAVLSALQSHR